MGFRHPWLIREDSGQILEAWLFHGGEKRKHLKKLSDLFWAEAFAGLYDSRSQGVGGVLKMALSANRTPRYQDFQE